MTKRSSCQMACWQPNNSSNIVGVDDIILVFNGGESGHYDIPHGYSSCDLVAVGAGGNGASSGIYAGSGGGGRGSVTTGTVTNLSLGSYILYNVAQTNADSPTSVSIVDGAPIIFGTSNGSDGASTLGFNPGGAGGDFGGGGGGGAVSSYPGGTGGATGFGAAGQNGAASSAVAGANGGAGGDGSTTPFNFWSELSGSVGLGGAGGIGAVLSGGGGGAGGLGASSPLIKGGDSHPINTRGGIGGSGYGAGGGGAGARDITFLFGGTGAPGIVLIRLY